LTRQNAAPRAGFGEERADLNKADHSVKKKLREKKNCWDSSKNEAQGGESDPSET